MSYAPLFLKDQTLLRKHWQYIGPTALLAATGCYTTTLLDQPLLVLRDKEGQLRCLANVCRHRGGRLVQDGQKLPRQLTCSYHSWCYEHSGKLTHAPGFAETPDLALNSFAITSFHNLLFVCLTTPGPQPWLEIGAMIQLEDYKFQHRDIYRVKANWRVYMENYLEGYHIKAVHPELAGALDTRHYRYQNFPWGSRQQSPISASPYSSQEGTASYFTLFPNNMLNLLPGRLQVNAVLPVSDDETVTVFDYFYSEPNAEKRQALFAQDRAFSDLIQKQDMEVCEIVDKNMRSPFFRPGPLCPGEEDGLGHFRDYMIRGR